MLVENNKFRVWKIEEHPTVSDVIFHGYSALVRHHFNVFIHCQVKTY